MNLDVEKTCYPNPFKIGTMLTTKNKMYYVCNDKLKQVLTVFTKRHLRVFDGTND